MKQHFVVDNRLAHLMLMGYKTFTQVKEDIKRRSREMLDSFVSSRDTSVLRLDLHKSYSEAKNRDYYSRMVSQFAERHPLKASDNKKLINPKPIEVLPPPLVTSLT